MAFFDVEVAEEAVASLRNVWREVEAGVDCQTTCFLRESWSLAGRRNVAVEAPELVTLWDLEAHLVEARNIAEVER